MTGKNLAILPSTSPTFHPDSLFLHNSSWKPGWALTRRWEPWLKLDKESTWRNREAFFVSQRLGHGKRMRGLAPRFELLVRPGWFSGERTSVRSIFRPLDSRWSKVIPFLGQSTFEMCYGWEAMHMYSLLQAWLRAGELPVLWSKGTLSNLICS